MFFKIQMLYNWRKIMFCFIIRYRWNLESLNDRDWLDLNIVQFLYVPEFSI